MPPPLLSRRLRPCQHPWSAKSVRRASFARARFPPAGDDNPQSNSTDGEGPSQHGHSRDNEVQDRRRSWWSSAMASISSFGSRTVPAKPESAPASSPTPPQSPSTLHATARTPPSTTQPVRANIEEHSADSRKQLISAHTKQSTRAVAEEPLIGHIPIRSVEDLPQQGLSAKIRPVETSSPVRGTGPTQLPSSVEESTSQGSDETAIQQQLQQLYKQVKRLQDALAQKTAQPLPTAEPGSKVAASQNTRLKPSMQTIRSSRHMINDKSRAAQARAKPGASHSISLARSGYRSSTTALVGVLNDIEKSMPGLGRPLASVLRKRLAVIALEAIAERDRFMLKVLSKYRTARPQDLVREELSFWQLADSMYESFIVSYVSIAQDLEKMAYPAVVPAVTRIREQLKGLVEEGNLSNWRLREMLREFQQHEVRPNSSSRHSVTAAPIARHVICDRPTTTYIYGLAWSCYRKSTAELVRIAEHLAKTMPDTGAPIVASIQNRLTSMMKEAKRCNDTRVVHMLSEHKEATVMRLAMKKPIKLSHARYSYRRSASVLASIAQDLEQMSSPTMANIAVKIRDRLWVIDEEARLEKDSKIRLRLDAMQEHDRATALDQPQRMVTTYLKEGGTDDRAHIATQSSSLADTGLVSTPAFIRKVNVNDNEQKVTASGRASERNATGDQPMSIGTYDFEGKQYTVENNDERFSPHRPDTSEGKPSRVAGSESEAAANPLSDVLADPGGSSTRSNNPSNQDTNSGQRLARQIHAHSRTMKSSDHAQTESTAISKASIPKNPLERSNMESAKPGHVSPGSPLPTDTTLSRPAPVQSEELSEQSLLEELFPETHAPGPTRNTEKRDKHSKLDLPKPNAIIRRVDVDPPKTLKEQVVGSFQNRGERITVLQLEHCSTELTEIDFRRLIPKGKHIEAWNRDGEFYKLIPGRDPLSLERLPFYYLLFNTPESAHAYQNNVTRLHKLAALHQPSNIFSAIPVPRGFLEDGEDVNAITKSYLLKPTEHPIGLRMIMQPYHPALRTLIERGGYNPIVPDVDDKGNHIYKVLLHIEGYEPSHSDLLKILRRDAYLKGMSLNLRNESSTSVHRLRDIINLKTRMLPISTTNPRAYGHFETRDQSLSDRARTKLEFDDPTIQYLMQGDDDVDEDNAKEVNQMVMNRVYNRWLIEFEDEDEAKRFAVQWHRRVLPDLQRGDRTWKDYEEVRMCNCEFLW